MDVIYFGQQNWDVTWTTKQHLLSRLARRGPYRVLYVDPDPRPAGGGLRVEGPNLWVVSHRRRLPKYPGPRSLRRRLRVRRAVRRLGLFEPVAVVAKPWHAWDALGFAASGRIYFGEDDWAALGGPAEYRATLARVEPKLLAGSDVTLAVSRVLLDRYRTLQPHAYLQENAVDPDHFSAAALAAATPHPLLAKLPRPRVGFVGQIDVRMNFDLMTALADRRPEWHFAFVGRTHAETDASALRSRPNVTFAGFVDYADLPGVLREIDVATIPYLDNDRGRSCNPLKAYEYLAAGLPTVSTPLPGLGRAREHLFLAETADEWERAIEAALADPDPAKRRRAVEEDTWDRRTDLLEQRLHEARERRGTSVYVAQTPGNAPPTPSPRRPVGRPDLKDAAAQRARAPRDAAGLWKLAPLARAARRANLRPLNRALIARANSCHLGDLLAVVPMLRALRSSDPKLKIDLGVDPPDVATALLAGSPWVDSVSALNLDGPPRDRLRRAGELFAKRYKILLTGTANYFSATLALCGARRQVGLDDGWPGQRLLTRTVPLDASVHEVDNNLALLRRIGLKVIDDDAPPQLDEAAVGAARPRVARLLEEAAGRRVLLVHPGSKRPSRRMPLKTLADAIRRVFADQSVVVALTGVGDEAALAADLAAKIGDAGRVIDLCNQTDLPALVALVDAADVVLSPDTGVMHLARLRGRPLVALLGPGNDRRWGPTPRGGGPAVSLRARVPCSPCDRWACEYHWCMKSLDPITVAAEVTRLLGGDDSNGLRRRQSHRTWRALSADAAMPLLPVAQLPVADAADARAWLARQPYPAVRLVDPEGRTLAESPAAAGRAATLLLTARPSLPPAWEVEFEVARRIADGRASDVP